MPNGELAVVGDEVLPSLHLDVPQFSYLSSTVFSGGMLLGVTADRDEMLLELVRPAPTRVTVLAEDPWLARLITIRAAGMGAPAIVATDRAAPWEYFVNVIGGQRPIATIRTDHASTLPAPNVGAPLIIVEDARDVPPETYAPRMAWQTTIHLRAGVNERSRALLDSSHAVLVCRLGGESAAAVATALGLGDGGAETVRTLEDHEVLVIADRRAHRTLVQPTPTERRML